MFSHKNRIFVGTETSLDSLCRNFNIDPSYFLDTVLCLKLPYHWRSKIGNILKSNPPKQLLFAVLLAKGKLITLARPKKHTLFPSGTR